MPEVFKDILISLDEYLKIKSRWEILYYKLIVPIEKSKLLIDRLQLKKTNNRKKPI